MKNKYTLKEKFRYFFDNTLSAGPIAIIGWLAVLSLLIILVAGGIILLLNLKPAGAEDMSFLEAVWQSLMRSMDPGTVAGDEGWKFRTLSIVVTIGGIFILSTLIGTLTAGLESKLDVLRKGRSKVIERDYTLILGWSPKIVTIISELIIANENQKKPRIVIMADMDKVEMEDELREKIPDRKNTKIICRTGSSMSLTDLEIVNPNLARSIIVLAPQEDNSDISVIKTVLAITNGHGRKKEKFHIVAEIQDEKNLEAAKLVGKDEAIFVYSHDLIARVTAQTCRQSGLSIIYTELMDFDGDEIYFDVAKSLIGKTYKDALFAYDKSAVMGLMEGNGKVTVNPSMDTVIKQGDMIIAISEDDDTVVLSGRTEFKINSDAISHKEESPLIREKNLIMGWNRKAVSIILELDEYVLAGSELVVVSDDKKTESSVYLLNDRLKNQRISFTQGNITDRKVLEEIQIDTFDHIIILGNSALNVQEADAMTLIALLHIRNISEEAGKHFNVVSEMFDLKNRQLAEVAKADDYIVSDNLVSLMLSQLSENKKLKTVFDDLFDSDGSEIYLKPATDYIKAGASVNFFTILEAAAQRGHTAIGYRFSKNEQNPDEAYGIVLNPDKNETIVVDESDKIVVLAED